MIYHQVFFSLCFILLMHASVEKGARNSFLPIVIRGKETPWKGPADYIYARTYILQLLLIYDVGILDFLKKWSI